MKICAAPDCGKPVKGRGYCNGHYKRLMRHGDPLAGPAIRGSAAKYVAEVVIPYNGKDCLTWPFPLQSNGYAKIWVGEGKEWVHRIVCTAVHGCPPTPKHQAAHSCGNGHYGCVNPRHLSWKTKAQNEADKLVHGTHNRGERHVSSKLTSDAVSRIRSLKGAVTQEKLADEFGVSKAAVSNAQSGKSWAWLEASK